MTKKTILTLLDLILILTLLFSAYIYTSYYSMFSWHENCGTQFLTILIISCPILLTLSILYYLLLKNTDLIWKTKNIPLISVLVFLFTLLADGGKLNFSLITIGTLIIMALLLSTIFISIKNKFI